MSDSKKDTYSVSLSTGDSNFRSIFSSILRNDHHTFVLQKCEKLASALYMITGYMSNNEPLRTKLRTCALDLVSSTADVRHGGDQHETFGSRCLEIGTILRLSERAGLVSSMNAKILCDEYAELASFVREHRDTIFGGHVIQDTKQAPARSDSIGHSIVHRTNNGKRHSHRQDSILSLFDKKDKITVKDAVSAIEGCSEKTIQREIMSLVADGVLLKEGERRWSTYRRAQNPLSASQAGL
jgi:hypothetical protein